MDKEQSSMTISVEPETILEAKRLLDSIKASHEMTVDQTKPLMTVTLRVDDVKSISAKIDNLSKNCRRDVREGEPL